MRSVFLLAVLSTGCVVEMDEGEIVGDEVETSSRVALNGLAASTSEGALTVDPSLLPTLARGSLRTAGTRVPGLFATATGREQFSYLYSCAEASNRRLTVVAPDGTSYSYSGALGIAAEWTTNALSPTKYKLMTACMLARTNYSGVNVSISMRSTRFDTPAFEQLQYTVLEGAFWGDVFTPGGTKRACASPTKLSGVAISTLPQRECTTSSDGVTTKCGFGYAGECSQVCVTDLTKMIGYANCEGNGDSIAVYVAKP